MALTLLLFFVATFGMVAAGAIGFLFLAGRNALREGAGEGAAEGIGWVESSDLLKTDSLSTISFWDKLLARVDYVEIMRIRLAEAGLSWSVGRLTLLMLLVGSFAFGVLANLDRVSTWAAAVGGVLVSVLPYVYVLRLRDRRFRRFEDQFPDALDSLARALRAGHPLAAGLQLVASESPAPLAGEWRITAEERALGLPWDQALDNLARRMPLVEVATFVAAVKLQNRTGGKLNEVLGRLAETVREAAALKGEVRAISAHGKLTGLVLTVLPIGIAGVMAMVNPEYLSILWTRPAGQLMTAGAVVCLLLAHFVIRKMVDIRL